MAPAYSILMWRGTDWILLQALLHRKPNNARNYGFTPLIGVRRLHHQMKMISHQTISVDLEAGFLTRLGQGLEEIVARPLIQKDRFPAVSPAEEMINGPGIFDSDLARHRLDSPPSPSPPQAQKCPKLWFDPNGA